jgi:hypothetical protein
VTCTRRPSYFYALGYFSRVRKVDQFAAGTQIALLVGSLESRMPTAALRASLSTSTQLSLLDILILLFRHFASFIH